MNHIYMVIDLGNTRLKMGVFKGDKLLHAENMNRELTLPQIWDSWNTTWSPDRIAFSSTAILSEEAKEWLNHHGALMVSSLLQYPFDIQYKTPETLGQDRLAALSAVYALYNGMNVLVMDCGTCITYDILLSDGCYVGGNIAPGIRMRLRSMHEYTDRLPLVNLPEEVKWIGQSTTEALQSGGVAMAIMEAKGMIFYLKEKYGPLRTVLTGGDAGLIGKHLSGDYDVHDDLVLTGLNEILKNNED